MIYSEPENPLPALPGIHRPTWYLRAGVILGAWDVSGHKMSSVQYVHPSTKDQRNMLNDKRPSCGKLMVD